MKATSVQQVRSGLGTTQTRQHSVSKQTAVTTAISRSNCSFFNNTVRSVKINSAKKSKRSLVITAETPEDEVPMPTCTNDFPASDVILSTEEEDIEAQIDLIKKQNAALLSQLSEVKDQTKEREQEIITASETSLGSMSGLKISSDKTVTEDVVEEDLSDVDITLQEWLYQPETPQTDDPMSLILVTSEVAPYSKTGGLGDVAGSLPPAFAERGHRTMVIAPRYLNGKTDHLYENATYTGKNIGVWLFGEMVECGLYHEFRDGVDFVFIDHPSYHREGNPYGNQYGAYGDNLFRFTLLSLVACEVPLQLELGGFAYGDKVMFMANDWHSSLVCVYVAAKYRPYGVYKDARTVLAIHNMAHHGTSEAFEFDGLGLPGDWYGALEWVFPEDQRQHELDEGLAINPLKGALVTCDRILTVSQGYAYEITTPEGGFGMDGLLRGRQHVLNGIVNGVDLEEWNPALDEHIAAKYWPGNMDGKKACKLALQKELGFEQNEHIPLVGFIGRLDTQKGPELIQDAVHNHGMLHRGIQLVMLGSGESHYEEWMAYAEREYYDNFRGWVGFSVPVAHRITAGCDVLLMPSKFEPCGLNQLYAMRYGTIPVAHATGGLRDTIEDFNPYAQEMEGSGTGMTFSPFTGEAMYNALFSVLETYWNHKDQWRNIQKRAMGQDFSWQKSAAQYEQVFRWAQIDPPYC